ncbi:MAG: lytic transglycosylase F [Deltaproteobacteria bacterium]|nr:MAG: lytic transglycosylase F [Deltaproteobacteria bacterium]
MSVRKRTIYRSMLVLALSLAISIFLPFYVFAAQDLEKAVIQSVNQKWTGDFEQMVDNRVIRVLIPYSKTFYFLDGATQKGATYELVREFEKMINKQLKTRHLKVQVLFIPTSRNRLIPALAEGFGDIAAGNLTITDKRMQRVDFCDPVATGVNEILVTGPESSPVKDMSDLSGQEIHVRKSSSYYESLKRVNKTLSKAGKSEIKIIEANEHLEDEDLLEMLNAGLIPMVVIDSHKGKFWAQIFENITLHPDIKFRENAKIAWAIRKNSPELKKVINAFVKTNKKGTLMGNILFNRYLKSTKYVKNNLADKDRERFEKTIHFFQKYAGMYDFDWLMLAALAYQESTIDQSKRSHVGAIGVMQVMPSTATDKNVNIPDIEKIESNIHAGTKYLNFMMNRYFNDPAVDRLNRALLTFASYNAGPARVSKLRKEAKTMNLDPNVWFKNVEIVAAKRIGRETVQYVNNIFKYYIAYTFIADQMEQKNKIEKK